MAMHCASRSISRTMRHMQILKAAVSTQAGNSSSYYAKLGFGAMLSVGLSGGGLIYALENSINAGDLQLHPTTIPWSHAGIFDSFDYKSVRRGYEVYKQVCAACHSMKFICYRHFVNVFMTEEEAKAEAAEAQIPCLDDTGQPSTRSGIITDTLPDPYPNKVAAKAANSGALPPDLSIIALGRHGYESYIFSLLVGYVDAPAGVTVDEGKAYNPYFPGGIIGMPQQLFDEGIEYKDGTPASQSQQAKDVSTFLRWSAEPFHDDRKKLGVKLMLLSVPLFLVALYWKKHIFTTLKSEKFAWRTVKGREPPSTPKV